jgi:hypothetical protein
MRSIPFALALWFITVLLMHVGNDVTAAQVNGTRKMKGGEFKIWALGQQRLQIEFFGTYEYKSPAAPTANTGEGSGIARIEGDTAIFKPEGAEDECKITLKFTGGNWWSHRQAFAVSAITSSRTAPTKELQVQNQSWIPLNSDRRPLTSDL